MPVRSELQVRLANSPGVLAGLTRILGDGRVDIVAIGLDSHGQLRLIVNNHVRAAALLRERHYPVVEGEAIVASVADGPGGLASVLSMLGDAGVNVDYVYGSGPGRGGPSVVVIGTSDPLRDATAAGL
jgi:hypothetical protein